MTQQDALNWAQGGWRSDPHVKTIAGKLGIDTDGRFGFQCKDFVNAYGMWLGHPLKPGDARTLWEQPQDPWYLKVSSPQPGDISVFKPNTSNGNAGHTDIVLGGNFQSVAQNWGIGSNGVVGLPPAIVSHVMSGAVYGFLRPQFNQGGSMAITSGQVDKVFKMGLHRDPTSAELNSPDYHNNPGLLIDTVWNNGGSNYLPACPSPAEVRSAAVTYGQTFTEDQVAYYAARPWETLLNDLLPAVNDMRLAAEKNAQPGTPLSPGNYIVK